MGVTGKKLLSAYWYANEKIKDKKAIINVSIILNLKILLKFKKIRLVINMDDKNKKSNNMCNKYTFIT